jgi:hypothetical protein
VAAREAALVAGRLAATGRPQSSVIYVSDALRPRIAQALAAAPQPALRLQRAPFGVPLSDAAGLVMGAREGGVSLPFASWISAPLYLLDPADDMRWLDPDRLEPTLATVTAMVEACIVT